MYTKHACSEHRQNILSPEVSREELLDCGTGQEAEVPGVMPPATTPLIPFHSIGGKFSEK